MVYRGNVGGADENDDAFHDDNDSESDGNCEERKDDDEMSSINSDAEEIKELKSEKKRILESIDEENIHDKVVSNKHNMLMS